jgi:hypothetical protein
MKAFFGKPRKDFKPMPQIGELRKKGGLLKTGQTTQYGGYQDDGALQKGLSRSLVVLTRGQYAGTTNITLNSKTDAHSNNCVYDRRTKLMWSRYAIGSVGPASDGKLPYTTNANGEGIFAFAAAANTAKLASYADWRVPNIFEFSSIALLEPPVAKPDPVAFPSWSVATYYLSSTVYGANTLYSLYFHFSNMIVSTHLKTDTSFCVLVRGA